MKTFWIRSNQGNAIKKRYHLYLRYWLKNVKDTNAKDKKKVKFL